MHDDTGGLGQSIDYCSGQRRSACLGLGFGFAVSIARQRDVNWFEGSPNDSNELGQTVARYAGHGGFGRARLTRHSTRQSLVTCARARL